MSLLDEWNSICELARAAADDLLHLETTTLLVKPGAPAAAVLTRIDAKGDVDSFIDPAADAALLEIHAEATAAMVAMHEARVSLVAGIASAIV